VSQLAFIQGLSHPSFQDLHRWLPSTFSSLGLRLCCRVGPRDASFTSQQLTRDIQDYDNDALVVHMGAFEPPPEADHRRARRNRAPQEVPGTTSDSSLPSTTASGTGDDAEAPSGPVASKDVAAAGDTVVKPAAAAAAAAGKAEGKAGTGNGAVALRGAVGARRPRVLHLYAVAAPGMRRVPGTTRDITQCLSWGAPVELKRRWTKVQKGYFDAPGRLLSIISSCRYCCLPEKRR